MNYLDEFIPTRLFEGLQTFIVAILVLLIGWLLAIIISGAVEKAFRKLKLDEKIFSKIQSGEGEQVDYNKIVGKIVFYILLVIVFIVFFNLLNLDMIATPLSDLVSTFFLFIPAVLKAAIILALAFIIAGLLRWLVITLGNKAGLDKLFSKLKIADTVEKTEEYVKNAGQVVFYLILLLFLPGVLDALNISGVAEPFSDMLATVLGFIPVLVKAAITFAIGWLIASIVKKIVRNLLQAAGSEKLVDKLNLNKTFEGTTLAAFVSNLVFIIILIPVTISALEKLNLKGITDPAISMLNEVFNLIPSIIIAAAIVLVGIWLGKLVGDFVSGFLERVGFNNITTNMQIGSKDISSGKMAPANVVGYIVQVLIVFFLAIQALNLIKLEFLVNIATAVTAYLPSVLAAVLILGIALILANIVEKVLVNILNGPAVRILAGFAKYTIYALAAFMALTQLGIATSIVASAFTLILGALALAFGLAFGLGGKEFAQKYLHKFDKTIEETNVNDKE
ncbi:MAG TPA: mechanosensitive ion channel [Pseudogracilibacillus sp.]|nr:mechanosensitive ion channel [Pseudogracilibacillus sp.]